MQTMDVRRRNLARVMELLRQEGLATPEAQAEFLGNVVTPAKLRLMVEAASAVPEIVARAIEHRLGLDRGWMDQDDPPAAAIGRQTRRAAQPLPTDDR